MPAMENEHYSLLCQCAGGKPAATLQWIWGGDKVNSKTWVVEQDEGLLSRTQNWNFRQAELGTTIFFNAKQPIKPCGSPEQHLTSLITPLLFTVSLNLHFRPKSQLSANHQNSFWFRIFLCSQPITYRTYLKQM